MLDNLTLYNQVREVPKQAQKMIRGGRLNGMTDINPMWRIKTLTEQFGVCGVGWRYNIKKTWTEKVTDEEITANIEIELFIKVDGEWSEPIVGLGGSMLSTKQKNGIYVNDECYKMALTDAISVACKALGFGADIYWQSDNTKYNDNKKTHAEPKQEAPEDPNKVDWRQMVIDLAKERGMTMAEIAKDYKLNSATTEQRFEEVYNHLRG
ncbi:MAG: hypothetical protein PUK21_01400 [Peptostreptococcaceae bacterium]|nr:hypothetical protein [Peptostreptococcaceae bacterium]MDY5738664.1 hypothetical protein [Anaerovoracaceae bacterium]